MKRNLRSDLRNDETGAVLIFAMGFIVLVGLIGAALLNYAATSTRAATALRPSRGVQFAADGAVEGGINKLRVDPVARCAGNPDFYKANPPLNGQVITLGVQCSVVTTGAGAPYRRAIFTATCAAPGTTACPANKKLLVAQVRFTGTKAADPIEVESWSVSR